MIKEILLYNTTWTFILEIVIRCFLMFLLILIFLKLSGRRGVRQLSIFEIAIILSLGTAAGDPMMMKEIPIIHAFVVMATIIILYRLVTWTMMKIKFFERLIEGKPLYIVENGMMVIESMKKEKYSHDEFFAEMRQQNIEHLGQIRVALLETDGCLSIVFFEEKHTKWGLPIFPTPYKKSTHLDTEQFYSCMYCGMTQYLKTLEQNCVRCNRSDWAKSLNTPRTK